MKLAFWRTEKERNILVSCILIFLSLIILIFVILHDSDTWKEDVDGDGVDEIVKETHFVGGRYVRTIIQEDGTLYQTEYTPQGDISHEWKLIPDPDRKGEYSVYIWDERKEQWLLDQDQNGIPDKNEK